MRSSQVDPREMMQQLNNNLVPKFTVVSFVVLLVLAVATSMALTTNLGRTIDLFPEDG